MAGILSNSDRRVDRDAIRREARLPGMTDAQYTSIGSMSQHDASTTEPMPSRCSPPAPQDRWSWVLARLSLGDLHDAEDAFQATFLVLARRASSLREPANLGPWLHGVARRTAQKAKARRSRLERLIQRVGALTRIKAESEAEPEASRWPGGGRDLHEEIGRLPEKYRTPVVLCDLEGLVVKRPRGNSAGPWARWESG